MDEKSKVLSKEEKVNEVLKEAFLAVGYFFWPAYFNPTNDEYMESFRSLFDISLYENKKKLFESRGMELLAALRSNKNLKIKDHADRFEISAQDAAEFNRCAATLVDGFIKDRQSASLIENCLKIWDELQKNPKFFGCMKHKG
jgi:hypothetical protein